MCSRKRLTFIKDFINNESVCHFMVVQLFKLSTKDKLPLNQEITILQENILTLTRIPCSTKEIRSHVPFLSWDVFHSKGVLLDCYRPPKYSVVLVRSIL